MFVAIMTMIRYLGGGFGGNPSVRRTTRLITPRGFFRPESSESRDCRVPMPPPPIIPAIIRCWRTGPSSGGSNGELIDITWLWIAGSMYAAPRHPD